MQELILAEKYYQGQDLPKELVTELCRSDGNSFLDDYLLVTNYNHQESIKVTCKEIGISFFPLIASYGIGAIAPLAFIRITQTAAKDNLLYYYLNPIGAVVLNTLVNGYFFYLVVSPLFIEAFKTIPGNINTALCKLQNLNPNLCAKFLRGIKELGLKALIMLPAFFSAYPFYALDKSESDDPEWIADLILASALMLQYKGVETIVYKLSPMLFAFFKKGYLKCNDAALKDHETATIIARLKKAHREVLERSLVEINKLMQKSKREKLDPLVQLLEKDNPSINESAWLLFKLCELTPKEIFQASSSGRKIIQGISLIITAASLPGYFLKTKVEAAKYADFDDPVNEWFLGAAIFLTYAALSFDISWDVFGNLYNLTAYAANGIKTSWRKSTGIFDFVNKAWQGKTSMASWHRLIQFPLPIQQNPRIMLSMLGLLYTLSYWSTQTSTYLNEEQLGEKISYYLEAATIIAAMVFNAFPADKVLGSSQCFLTRLLGTKRSKEEIRLQTFLQNQIKLVNDIDDDKFLMVLNSFVEKKSLVEEHQDLLLEQFFGNKTSSEIFDDHEYAKKPLTTIVKELVKTGVEKASEKASFIARFSSIFSRPHHNAEKTNLLLDDDATRPKSLGIVIR